MDTNKHECSEPAVMIERAELERLWREANQEGLEGRVITAVEFKFDGDCGAIDGYRFDWMPAPTPTEGHHHSRPCGCDMCRPYGEGHQYD